MNYNVIGANVLKTLKEDGKEGSSLKMLPGILRTGACL